MRTLAQRVRDAITAAGVPITKLSIGDTKAMWLVQPPELQGAAQPTIDAFDPNDPAHDSAELNLELAAKLDDERIFSALVWAILDTYSAPATKAKYTAARTKIVNAYKTQPWK